MNRRRLLKTAASATASAMMPSTLASLLATPTPRAYSFRDVKGGVDERWAPPLIVNVEGAPTATLEEIEAFHDALQAALIKMLTASPRPTISQAQDVVREVLSQHSFPLASFSFDIPLTQTR